MNLRRASKSFASKLEALLSSTRDAIELPAMPLSAEAFTVLALMQATARPILWLHATGDALAQAHRDLIALAEGDAPHIDYFPAWESFPDHDGQEDPEIAGFRHSVLLHLLSAAQPPEPSIIVTSIKAVLQKVPSPLDMNVSTTSIHLDDDIDLSSIAEQLQQHGYSFEPEISDKGQATVKGGMLDVWPPTSPWPLRIELFGSTVESIRTFDPATQRSIEKCPLATLSPGREWAHYSTRHHERSVTLLDYLPEATIVWSEPGAVATHARTYETLCADGNTSGRPSGLDALMQTIASRPELRELTIGPDHPVEQPHGIPHFASIPNAVGTIGPTQRIDQVEEARTEVIDALSKLARKRHHVAMFFDTDGSQEHFEKSYATAGSALNHRHHGALSEGFLCSDMRLAVVAESDLYGRRKTLRQRYDPYAGSGRQAAAGGIRVSDFSDMDEGDLVVHADHGIGRYLGLREITFNSLKQEVLAIEYADSAKLYVPMSQAHLLSRYVGISSRTASLHKLGGKRWVRDKDAAQRAVLDLAAELLDVQAARNLLEGHAFPPDTAAQHEFETAFPFDETQDQVHVIRKVKNDMESTRPMDRLICGDAGYGKTEVAMRAAFKAVQDGCQVAMLVPTTILAQQHYRTFSERMAGFPVRIGVLSRFSTQAMRHRTLEALREGQLDIIIGTHALVQANVEFSDLGLVIIDEEQRFGVTHKEHLKQMKRLVDVLTLSATPIPRTLYLSMTGARDMSLLQTPPRERMAIETIVATADDEVIREAILREISRDGQVYYLHNRVMTIGRLGDRLKRLVPEARIEVAHGQMKSSELAAVMRRFSGGEFDVLLCTTIIESGMDIPNANTILIDRADRFGIADLYQLRGRVGRSHHKAYAYLLLPPHGYVDSDARERIRAIRKHAGLGAGFNLAIRDMEIRGAGNILGAAQSGHVSAVGFGLYCQLLKRSVARLKGEAPPAIIDTELRLDFISLAPEEATTSTAGAAYLPHAYVRDERIRVSIYRRIAEATAEGELEALLRELHDRFGPPPPAVTRLITMAGIRIMASSLGLQRVEVRRSTIRLQRDGDYLTDGARLPRLLESDPDARLSELRDNLLNMLDES